VGIVPSGGQGGTGRRALQVLVSVVVVSGSAQARQQDKEIDFKMVRSAAATNAGCLPRASADVEVESLGPVEKMRVRLQGLPPNTEFDFFVIQVPDAPFGLSWYQGDIETDSHGRGTGKFVGRFNTETFIVAPGTAPAPVVHEPDASSNPATGPVHTFHLGLWFNSPADAAAAGCPDTVTPFNGDHNAGIQVLSTRNFANDQGPLRQLTP
jgi:hypothetical protein